MWAMSIISLTMVSVYDSQGCRNSGTWCSPDDAKLGPTAWAHQEGKQDMGSRQEMGHPISSRRWTRHARTPGGSGWPPGPTSPRGIAPNKVASGFRGPAGGRTTPGGFVRTEEDKNANTGARRQKTWAPRKVQSLSLGPWGCQRTTSTFPKG